MTRSLSPEAGLVGPAGRLWDISNNDIFYLSTLVVVEINIVWISVLYFCRSQFLCKVQYSQQYFFNDVVFLSMFRMAGLNADQCLLTMCCFFVFVDKICCYVLGLAGSATSTK